MDRDVPGSGVDHQLRDNERANAVRAEFDEPRGLLFVFAESADAAATDDAGARGVFLGQVQAAVLDRLHRRNQRELRKAIEASRGAGVERFLRLEVAHLSAELDLVLRDIE